MLQRLRCVNLFITRALNRVKWLMTSRKFAYIGVNSHVNQGFVVRSPEHISIGDDFSAGSYVSLTTWKNNSQCQSPTLTIGNHVVMAEYSSISCSRSITIGDGVIFGVNSFVSDNSHGATDGSDMGVPPAQRPIVSKGPVIIGNNVWIGRNVCILPNVTIGEGAIIGANAVVTHDIPAYCIAAGVPARIIKRVNQ